MVKKIKKYLKFVVCCALILSLIAPSYAALSASDGSAFVTKAEFDSALADFNARLTTFEAGINSKIDSQVTSYLDRNGIWNGQAQTMAKTDFRWGSVANDACAWPKNFLGLSWTSGTPFVVMDGSYDFITSINKSGLLFVTGKYGWDSWVRGSVGTATFMQYVTGKWDDEYTTITRDPHPNYDEWKNAQGIASSVRFDDWRVTATAFSAQLRILVGEEVRAIHEIADSFVFQKEVWDTDIYPIGAQFKILNGQFTDPIFVSKSDKVRVQLYMTLTPQTMGGAGFMSKMMPYLCFEQFQSEQANRIAMRFTGASVY